MGYGLIPQELIFCVPNRSFGSAEIERVYIENYVTVCANKSDTLLYNGDSYVGTLANSEDQIKQHFTRVYTVCLDKQNYNFIWKSLPMTPQYTMDHPNNIVSKK